MVQGRGQSPVRPSLLQHFPRMLQQWGPTLQHFLERLKDGDVLDPFHRNGNLRMQLLSAFWALQASQGRSADPLGRWPLWMDGRVYRYTLR